MAETNYSKSVAGVVIRDGKVLLARHTYGKGTGKLICPGGYVEYGESPEDAVAREYREETGIEVSAEEIIAVRFNAKDWYIAFRAKYISGEARSDNDENSEVIWMSVEEALEAPDVPYLSKELIRAAISSSTGLEKAVYEDQSRAPASLFRIPDSAE